MADGYVHFQSYPRQMLKLKLCEGVMEDYCSTRVTLLRLRIASLFDASFQCRSNRIAHAASMGMTETKRMFCRSRYLRGDSVYTVLGLKRNYDMYESLFQEFLARE